MTDLKNSHAQMLAVLLYIRDGFAFREAFAREDLSRAPADCRQQAQWALSAAQHRLKLVDGAIAAGQAKAPAGVAPFDLVAHLERQRDFSLKTFGPGPRTKGVVDHIRKELAEIEADPADIMEWVDVIILAFDGAWRAGWEPLAIVNAIVAKQTKNEARQWPDWRTADPDKAIEHVRADEGEPHG